MKKVFSILLTAIMMVAFSTAALAQENKAQQPKAKENKAQQPSKKQRMSREQMAEMQAKHISRQLALDDATSQKFIETFSAYQKELWALRPHGKGMKNRAEMTDAEAEKAIKDQFDHSQKVLTLRQEYYKKYSKFLTAKQIQRVYDLEKQSMNRLAKRGPINQRGKRNAGPRPNAGHPNALGKGKRDGKGPGPRQPKSQKQ